MSQIIDASGLATIFHYDYPGEPYLVTSIVDPYGRTSSFTYVSAAGKLRIHCASPVLDGPGIVTQALGRAGAISPQPAAVPQGAAA